MDTYGFEPIQQLPGQNNGLFFLGALIGAGASLLGGALKKDPEPPRRYPELKKNQIMALAMLRGMMKAPKYDWSNLPSATAAPGLPNFAAMLARAKTGGTSEGNLGGIP